MDKERENAAALEALPDLLDEVDKLDGPERLLALIQVGSRVSRMLRVRSFLIRALPWYDALQGCFYVMLCTQPSHLHGEDASMHAALTQTRSLHPSQGSLAANIFDWGAKACVDLYQNATILEMYRQVRGLGPSESKACIEL